MTAQRLKSHAVTLGIASSTVVRKAGEFCRMLDAKGHSYHKQLNLVGDAKLFICLDIAAADHGQSFDKALAIKKSSMTKRNYQNALRAFQTLLSVNAHSSLRECAVTLGHPQLVSSASALVKQYLDKHLAGDASLVTNAVNMAALMIAARKDGVTPKVSKVLEMAGCSKASFERLKLQMEQLSQPVTGLLKNDQVAAIARLPVRSSPRKHKSTDKGIDSSDVAPKRKLLSFAADEKVSAEDSFEVWKAKILTLAYEKLANCQ
ncbi:origin recognition complex subunit 6-like [Watersipora subatra]|uniref:origin recognition complex subunit 6-like n=1 Tax=Watersipora subatra TaxID=2589382 RepID=UPI00355C773A